MDDEVYYRAREAAKYISVGVSTIWMYRKQGKLTGKKLSSRVTVFKKSELDNLGM